MPFLNIKITAPASQEMSLKIATLLTDLTVSILGKKRELIAVGLEYLPYDSWFIGGSTVSTPTFYLDIKITEGTNTKSEKASYIKQVFFGMEGILGKVANTSYIVIHEVRADAWGYQGETQELRYIMGKPL